METQLTSHELTTRQRPRMRNTRVARRNIGPRILPMAWLLVVLLATPLVGAAVTGAYAEPGGYVIALTGFFAACGIFAYLSPFAPPTAAFRTARVIIVVACALATALIRVTFATPAYQPSLFAFTLFLLSMLVLDGYIVLGVTAGLSVLTGALAQLIVLGSPMSEYLSLGYLLCILVLAVVWANYTKRLIITGNEFDARSAELLERRRADARELTRLRLRNALSTSGANEALQRVANTGSATPALVSDVRLAEASLRDHLSAPVFTHTMFTAEVSHARARGITVQLIGESFGNTAAPQSITSQLAASLMRILRDAEPDDTITVRYLTGTVPAQFSVVHDGAQAVTRYHFDAHGSDVDTRAPR